MLRRPESATGELYSGTRDTDLGRILGLLRSGRRCITLTGLGGIGKSTLAREAVARFRAEHPDIEYLELGAADLPASDIRDTSDPAGPRLVLLDGAEHLADAAAVVRDVLQQSPDVVLLITSRTVLGVPSEVVVPLRGLDETIAVDLFRELAAAESIPLAEDDTPILRDIVTQLGGSPLAIRLAVRLARNVPVAELQTLLRRDTAAVDPEPGIAAMSHQQADIIQWSIARLSGPARHLLRVLSVFGEWATLDSIEGVADAVRSRAGTAGALIAGRTMWLAELTESGLVDSDESLAMPGSPRRYRLHDDIREAARALDGSLPIDAIREEHRQWFVRHSADLARQLTTRREAAALEQLEAEFADVTLALDATLEQDPHTVLRITGLLGDFWMTRGHTRSGARLLRKALERLDELDSSIVDAPIEIALSLSHLKSLTLRAGTSLAAHRFRDELRARLEREADAGTRVDRDLFTLAAHLVFVGMAAHENALVDAVALRYRDHAIAAGDDYHAGLFSFYLARNAGVAGRVDAGVAHIDQALRHVRRTQNESFEARCLSQLILLTRNRVAPADLIADLRQVIDIHVRARSYRDAALMSVPLAIAYVQSGDAHESLTLLRRTLALAQRIHYFDVELYCVVLIAFADLSADSSPENVERCARLYGGVRPHLGRFRALVDPEYVALLEGGIQGLTAMLGAERLEQIIATSERSWSALVADVDAFAGQQMAVLSGDPTDHATASAVDVDAVSAALNVRERELLNLVLTGLSDKQIATHLDLRPNTVRSYNSRIFRKFGVSSRSELLALHVARG